MRTSLASVARTCLALSKVMVTSAMPKLRRVVEPLKMTSAISPPRRLLALCSPRIQRTASTMLLLPEPLGPTMAVMPSPKLKVVLSAKLLNPTSSRRLSMHSPQDAQWLSGYQIAVLRPNAQMNCAARELPEQDTHRPRFARGLRET